jgi:SAM-dependent methyltransferase
MRDVAGVVGVVSVAGESGWVKSGTRTLRLKPYQDERDAAISGCVAFAAVDKRRRLSTWLRGDGIEIGALHEPLRVHREAHVRYVDRLSVAEQRRQYPELADAPLVDVDVIAPADDLNWIDDASLDFVIANHLLEHLEDPIAGLLEFQRVLKPGGVLYLGLPDQRQTFDRDRELTTFEHLVRDHEEGPLVSRREHYVDWARNVDHIQPEELESYVDECMSDGYSIHFHCWQPDSFLDFLVATRAQFELDFEVVAFAPPEGADDVEFILVLAKGRSDGVRLPPRHPHARLPTVVLKSQLGPPLRSLRRVATRLRK